VPIRNVTVHWPLVNTGALVMRVQFIGAIKVGVQYKFVTVSLVLPGHAIARDEAFDNGHLVVGGGSGVDQDSR
jgi:hypothetical protein